MADATVILEAQFAAGVWTDITEDVLSSVGIRLWYGIDGNRPADNLASTGQMQFALRNDAGNSGGLLGYYSPIHANVRSGWMFGIPIRLLLSTGSSNAVVSITSTPILATVTTASPHGLSTGQSVTIAGANEPEYNGTVEITVTGVDTFTYAGTFPGSGGGSASLFLLLMSSGGGAGAATGTITWTATFVKFRGRVRAIAPDPGEHRSRRVYVVAHDHMGDLIESDVRELTIQIDQPEDVLVEAVLDALPTSAQPPARSIDTGLDLFPYAFDNVGAGIRAATLLKALMDSSYGWCFAQGDGTVRYQNRHSRATDLSAFTVSDTMHGLDGPSSLDGVYNHVRVTIHPKTIDAAATTVLYALSGAPPSIGGGAEITIWGDYRDPANVTRLVGGTEMVTPLVAYTDYTGNTEPTGSGLDKTGSLSINVSAFASTAKFVITNTDPAPVYLTLLQIRGKGVFDDGPQTFESISEEDYGDRTIDIDMPYQDNGFIGQSAADFIARQFRDLDLHVNGLTIIGNASDSFMTQALAREVGDKITISETVTGMSSVEAFIRRVELEITGKTFVTCRWGLTPAGPLNAWWALGVAGKSELGETTTLGF